MKQLFNDSENQSVTKNEKSKCIDAEEGMDNMIYHGIFSDLIVAKLLKNGMSKKDIIKTMKCGLKNLDPSEQNYFHIFNVKPQIMKSDYLSEDDIDNELLAKLKKTCLKTEDCLNIILSGLISQNESILFHLTSHGIVTRKILNWGDPVIYRSEKLALFLDKFDLNKGLLTVISQRDFNEGKRKIIDKFECQKEESSSENQTLECNCKTPMDKIYLATENYDQNPDDNLFYCLKNPLILDEPTRDEILEKQNFIKQNFMIPLTWVLSETIKCQPADPISYIGRHLLRWEYKNINPKKIQETLDFVTELTQEKKYDTKISDHTSKINVYNLIKANFDSKECSLNKF